MDDKIILAAIIGLIVGLSARFVIFAMSGLGDNPASMSARITAAEAGRLTTDLLAANGANATVLAVSDENGLYKVVVKDDNTGVAGEFYVTKDGFMLFQSGVADINSSIASLVSRRNFFDCLAAAGLKFYGSTETNSTLMQLQILGGSQFVDRIYVPCEGGQVQSCIDANVTEVPTFVYKNSSYTGVRALDWFIDLTDCDLTG